MAAARACGGLPGFGKAAADEIMAGKLTISPFPAVTVDPGRDGDINWTQNPFHHPTWQQDFQSGGWIEMLISGYLAGGPGARAYLARAEAIIRSWLAGVPVSGRDPQTMICLSEGFPGQAWIADQIDASVNYLAAHWQGPWNHGLVQDLKLMRIGCAYPPGAFGGDALKWRQTADSQILSSFQPNRLGPSIDPQGVVNEQATGYERFVYDLWQGGVPELAGCGYPLPPGIAARIAKMPAFLAEATQPDGNLVQIGDTYVEPPPALRAQRLPLVAVYDAGYVFGRSAWGPGGTFYSLRFGPGRQVHGHDDHMGLTYYSRGRNLIVNAGHTGYEVSAYRNYLRSPEAASTFISPDAGFRGAAATVLTTSEIGPASQFYELSDDASGGPRSRSVYVHQGPGFMLVLDRGSGQENYQQLWHLDPGLTVTSVTASSATATAPATAATATSPAIPATALRITRVPLPGQVIGAGSTTVVTGQTNPYQGWVSRQALQRTPAPVVIMNSTGTGTSLSAAMLTLIAATAPGMPVTATATVAPGGTPANGPYLVLARVGTATVPVTIP
ncbi:MAG: heparinase II/III family protein [Streptosporangiaceae bacterium]|nr:heparinase II/III family protein [Streptosporangiaceae bacterium]